MTVIPARIAVGIDQRRRVAVSGSSQDRAKDALRSRARRAGGAVAIVFTDIRRDGTGAGAGGRMRRSPSRERRRFR